MKRCRITIPVLMVIAVLILVGCSKQNDSSVQEESAIQEESAVSRTKNIAITVSLANRPADETLLKIAQNDSTVTNAKIESYTRDRLASLLRQVGFPPSADAREYALSVNMSLRFGLERKILTDPRTSIEVTSGAIVLSVPVLKLDGKLLADGKEVVPAFAFEGGLNFGGSDWQGVSRVCDMGIAHLLKEFAKNGIATERIIKTLINEQLLPKNPYTSSWISMFGSETPVRFHQAGNLWEALGEIGNPAVIALREGAKDTDEDISQEATKALESISKQD
ncbi:MAG: hypothetical protein AMJ92_00590 [candidate division Zixibacteria bacterium SM23_81]|nr:MAG: hypothetical protein AMJ92_00590 [candidate division Zixibacteria bacterium SM23_81]